MSNMIITVRVNFFGTLEISQKLITIMEILVQEKC